MDEYQLTQAPAPRSIKGAFNLMLLQYIRMPLRVLILPSHTLGLEKCEKGKIKPRLQELC